MYTEIIKIIEGGIVGDKEKVYNYSKVLIENLKKEGNDRYSKRIENALAKKSSSLVALDSFAAKPVDKESRMDIVSVEFGGNKELELILDEYIEKEVESFVKEYEKRDELVRKGLDISNSMLFYGPPGCGKTSLAHYIAKCTELPIVTARLDGLVSSMLGSTSKNIRKIFDYASKGPCVLFLDEFDVIAKVRNDKHELGELKRVVNTLLQNIDDFSDDSILIAATNHHELLDPAIWRRFNRIIELNKPKKKELQQLVTKYSNKFDNDFIENKKFDNVVNALTGLSHSDIATVFNNSFKKAVLNDSDIIHYYNIISEIYFYTNHSIVDEEKYIEFFISNGVTQNIINSEFGIPLRKVRDVAANIKAKE